MKVINFVLGCFCAHGVVAFRISIDSQATAEGIQNWFRTRKHARHDRTLSGIQSSSRKRNAVRRNRTLSVLTYNTLWKIQMDGANVTGDGFAEDCVEDWECVQNIKDVVLDEQGVPKHDITFLQEPTEVLFPRIVELPGFGDTDDTSVSQLDYIQGDYHFFISRAEKEAMVTILSNDVIGS